MNNDIRKIIKNTMNSTKDQEKKLKELQKRIKINNKYLYYEIYEELLEQYKEIPLEVKNDLRLKISFKSYEFVSEEDKEIINKLHDLVRAGICIYHSKHRGEILVDVKEVIEELKKDGFPDDSRLIDYTFAGWNDRDREKDNTLKITISVSRFKDVIKFALSPMSYIYNVRRR